MILFVLLVTPVIDTYGIGSISKITPFLQQKMDTNKNGRTLVSIWCESPAISDVKKNTDTQITSLKNTTTLKTVSNTEILESAKKIKANYRSSVKVIYEQANSEFISKYLNKESIVYVSRYAPMVIANLNDEEIYRLNYNNKVISIDYYEEDEFDTTTNSFSPQQEALLKNFNLSRQIYPYTGEGINIGVMDSGVPNTTETAGMNVVATLGNYNTTHPGFVASILREIAPNANYYFTGNVAGMISFGYIEWLLDQGVDVINMSLAMGNDGNSMYGNDAKWYEHVSYNHFVFFVKSSGNAPGVISCPGMAYNIMTVGAMQENSYGYYWANFSGYYTGNTYASKPDICAIGPSGTSEAAPRVAAAAALLIEADPLLIYSPELLKAILTASVDVSSNYSFEPTYRSPKGVNYMQAGAGLMDIDKALEVVANNQTLATPINENQTTYTYNIQINSSDVGSVVRVALAYAIPVDVDSDHTNGQSTSYMIPNLDLQIYAPGNTSIPAFVSDSSNNNIEIVEFVPSIAGYYTIKIVTVNGTTSAKYVYCGVAWSIQ